MTLRVVTVASRNPGKVRELAELARGALELRPLDGPATPEVEETGSSYLENALLKARAVARFVGGPALADDSGLEVDALGGAPGLRSARYAGPEASDADRCRALLAELEGAIDRRARFRCALALVDGERVWTAEGVLEGEIAHAPRGRGGFGYDPIFAVPELGGRTLGEVASEEKRRVSHRARAMRALLERLGDVAAGSR